MFDFKLKDFKRSFVFLVILALILPNFSVFASDESDAIKAKSVVIPTSFYTTSFDAPDEEVFIDTYGVTKDNPYGIDPDYFQTDDGSCIDLCGLIFKDVDIPLDTSNCDDISKYGKSHISSIKVKSSDTKLVEQVSLDDFYSRISLGYYSIDLDTSLSSMYRKYLKDNEVTYNTTTSEVEDLCKEFTNFNFYLSITYDSGFSLSIPLIFSYFDYGEPTVIHDGYGYFFYDISKKDMSLPRKYLKGWSSDIYHDWYSSPYYVRQSDFILAEDRYYFEGFSSASDYYYIMTVPSLSVIDEDFYTGNDNAVVASSNTKDFSTIYVDANSNVPISIPLIDLNTHTSTITNIKVGDTTVYDTTSSITMDNSSNLDSTITLKEFKFGNNDFSIKCQTIGDFFYGLKKKFSEYDKYCDYPYIIGVSYKDKIVDLTSDFDLDDYGVPKDEILTNKSIKDFLSNIKFYTSELKYKRVGLLDSKEYIEDKDKEGYDKRAVDICFKEEIVDFSKVSVPNINTNSYQDGNSYRIYCEYLQHTIDDNSNFNNAYAVKSFYYNDSIAISNYDISFLKFTLNSRKLVDKSVPTQDGFYIPKGVRTEHLDIDMICKELETNELYRNNVMWLSKTGFKSVSDIDLNDTISDDIKLTFKDDATKLLFEKFLSDNGLPDYRIEHFNNNNSYKFVFEIPNDTEGLNEFLDTLPFGKNYDSANSIFGHYKDINSTYVYVLNVSEYREFFIDSLQKCLLNLYNNKASIFSNYFKDYCMLIYKYTYTGEDNISSIPSASELKKKGFDFNTYLSMISNNNYTNGERYWDYAGFDYYYKGDDCWLNLTPLSSYAYVTNLYIDVYISNFKNSSVYLRLVKDVVNALESSGIDIDYKRSSMRTYFNEFIETEYNCSGGNSFIDAKTYSSSDDSYTPTEVEGVYQGDPYYYCADSIASNNNHKKTNTTVSDNALSIPPDVFKEAISNGKLKQINSTNNSSKIGVPLPIIAQIKTSREPYGFANTNLVSCVRLYSSSDDISSNADISTLVTTNGSNDDFICSYIDYRFGDVIFATQPDVVSNLKLTGNVLSWDKPDNIGMGTNENGNAREDEVINISDYKVIITDSQTGNEVHDMLTSADETSCVIPSNYNNSNYKAVVYASNIIGDGQGTQINLGVSNNAPVVVPEPTSPTVTPTIKPSSSPEPTMIPTVEPSSSPEPTVIPTAKPNSGSEPTSPTVAPSNTPIVTGTPEATHPSGNLVTTPSAVPLVTNAPSSSLIPIETDIPELVTPEPSASPTVEPQESEIPSSKPTKAPKPTKKPDKTPSKSVPTPTNSETPVSTPDIKSTPKPSKKPTETAYLAQTGMYDISQQILAGLLIFIGTCLVITTVRRKRRK